jgi:hypothetical protein
MDDLDPEMRSLYARFGRLEEWVAGWGQPGSLFPQTHIRPLPLHLQESCPNHEPDTATRARKEAQPSGAGAGPGRTAEAILARPPPQGSQPDIAMPAHNCTLSMNIPIHQAWSTAANCGLIPSLAALPQATLVGRLWEQNLRIPRPAAHNFGPNTIQTPCMIQSCSICRPNGGDGLGRMGG